MQTQGRASPDMVGKAPETIVSITKRFRSPINCDVLSKVKVCSSLMSACPSRKLISTVRSNTRSDTLHGLDNRRLIGFDNAHSVFAKGSRFNKRPKAMDHWHRTETDEGHSYTFKDAEILMDDFFDEVERVLAEHNIPFETVEVKEGDKP